MPIPKKIEIDVSKGIRAGLICFATLMFMLIFLFLITFLVARETLNDQVYLHFLIGTTIITGISTLSGFIMAIRSRLLGIILSLFAAAVLITWLIIFIHTNFIK